MMIRNLMRFQKVLLADSRVSPTRISWRVTVVLAMLLTLWPAAVQAQQQIYVPMVAVTTRNVAGSGEEPPVCNLSAEESAAAKLIAEASDQQRAEMICHPTLARVAKERAKDMAQRGYFSHTNPDGIGPNYLIVQAGYKLPDWYSTKVDANNVESIAAGFSTSADVVKGWLNSDGHRKHVLGLNSFYQDQEMYGIGYYYDAQSPYGHYWVFLSAHPEGTDVNGTPTVPSNGQP